MVVLRSLTLAAALAAVFVLPVGAQECGAGQPRQSPACLPAPPSSVQVNPNPATGGASTHEIDSPGRIMPVEAVLPMPVPRAEVAPLGGFPSAVGAPAFSKLSVPMRYQDPSDASCGVQALGMALGASPGSAPSSAALLGFLQGNGMMYEFGTGVEELAFAAQAFGYGGARPFHGVDLSLLQSELAAGRPVVVSLGSNGESQPGHFVTVTGISPDGQSLRDAPRWISYNDPTLGEQVMPAPEFLRLWGLQGYSGVIVAPEVPPAAPDPMPWVALAAGIMALVSTSPLGLRRQGVGGRIVSGTTSPSKSAPGKPAPKPAPKPGTKPKPKPAPAPRGVMQEEAAFQASPPQPPALPVPRGVARAEEGLAPPATPIPPTTPRFDTETPTPIVPVATETPAPPNQPTPTPTPVVTPTPAMPPGYEPLPGFDISPSDIIRWDARALRIVRGLGRAEEASALVVTQLDGGYVSVSAPAVLREEFGLAGTRYLPSTVAEATGSSLIRGAISGTSLTIGGLAVAGTNLYEYGLGEHKDDGIGSQEFWVSTGVDFGLSVGTGLTAAGLVAGGAAIAAAAVGTVVAAPVLIVVTAVVGVSLSIGIALTGLAPALKDNVNSLVDEWQGEDRQG